MVREAPGVGGFVFTGVSCRLLVGEVRSCLARTRRFSIASNMKRDASLVRSPPKPARAVHVRLSQTDTQTALPTPDPRLSHATTLAASTLSTWTPRSWPWLPAGLLALPLACLLLLTHFLTVLPQRLSPVLRTFISQQCVAGFGAPPVQVVKIFFARARVAAVQFRVAAVVESGARVPPPTPAVSSFHDSPTGAANDLVVGSRASQDS